MHLCACIYMCIRVSLCTYVSVRTFFVCVCMCGQIDGNDVFFNISQKHT
jgi:hypothetical protein